MNASAVTTPSSFSAMHLYRPPSTAVTGLIESAPLGNTRAEDGNEAVDSNEECTRTHEMEGVGWPVAAHSRMTVPPTMTSVLGGARVMLGGAGEEVGAGGGEKNHLNVQANLLNMCLLRRHSLSDKHRETFSFTMSHPAMSLGLRFCMSRKVMQDRPGRWVHDLMLIGGVWLKSHTCLGWLKVPVGTVSSPATAGNIGMSMLSRD